MKAVIGFENNWKLSRASVETLARIYIEKLGLPETVDLVKEIIREIKQSNQFIIAQINTFMRVYSGKFLNDVKVTEVHNIVPRVLRYQLAELFIGGSPASTFDANYIALGNGSGTPLPTDTQLIDETIRRTFTNRSRTDNIAYFDKYFSAAEVNGLIINEAGIFCDGTPTADSGFLLSRIEMNETMSPNETLTINATITINSAT